MSNEDAHNFALVYISPIAYVGCGLAMTFINKAILSYWHFPHPTVIIFAQCVFTVFLLQIMKFFKIISFEDFNADTINKLLVVSLLFSLNSCIALYSLANMNVAMYSILKKGTLLIVLFGETFYLGVKPSKSVIFSILLLFIGAMLAGYGELEYNLYAYAASIVSCFVQASWILILKKKQNTDYISMAGLLYYGSILSIPPLGGYLLLSNEIDLALNEKHLIQNPNFYIFFLFAIIFGMILNLTQYLSNTYNGPLTFTVLGQAKAIFATIMGSFFFGFTEFNIFIICGIIFSCVGTFLYTYLTLCRH